jgi:hypothetical protein
MTGLKNRVEKLEKVIAISEDLSFREYLEEFMRIIDGDSRCLPSQRKPNPELDARCDVLYEKYANQPSEGGRKKFGEEYQSAMRSLCDGADCPQCLGTADTNRQGFESDVEKTPS